MSVAPVTATRSKVSRPKPPFTSTFASNVASNASSVIVSSPPPALIVSLLAGLAKSTVSLVEDLIALVGRRVRRMWMVPRSATTATDGGA